MSDSAIQADVDPAVRLITMLYETDTRLLGMTNDLRAQVEGIKSVVADLAARAGLPTEIPPVWNWQPKGEDS